MRETETQKNWNQHYNIKKKKERPQRNLIFTIIVPAFIVFLCIFLSRGKIEEISIYKSNRNGIEMAQSINKVDKITLYLNELILNNIKNIEQIEKLEECKLEIKNLNLSEEYNNYKNKYINKIEAMQNEIKSLQEGKGPTKYIIEYNNISMIEELTKAFDKAYVQYNKTEENGIIFWYKASRFGKLIQAPF